VKGIAEMIKDGGFENDGGFEIVLNHLKDPHVKICLFS